MQKQLFKRALPFLLMVLVIIFGTAMIIAAFYSATEYGAKGSLFKGSAEAQTTFAVLCFVFIATLAFLILSIITRRRDLKTAVRKLQKDVKKAEEYRRAAPASDAEESEESSEPRFFMLGEIDQNMAKYRRPNFDTKITLPEICERFRHFAASRLHLYYSITDIRRFISNMASTHVLIMQGMSGTGKTSLAYAFGEFIKNHSVIVPIQPMWKERTDLLGYYNEFTKRFNETVLLQKMYEANYKEDIFVVVLDEMNIARVEYYFAEFLSLLEIPRPDRRYIDVVSDVWESDPRLLKNGQLKLPTNMWFIGTANNDDSTFAISDKVYDRAMIMNLDSKAEVFEGEEQDGIYLSAAHFDHLVHEARRQFRLSQRNRRRLRRLDDYMIEKFKITFGNRIMKQIDSYVPTFLACGGDELDALDDILSKKVFRKLETQNPIYVRNNVEALSAFLDELFGYDAMKLCKSYLTKFEKGA